MNRLIIESSTSQTSLALFADDELLVEEIFPGGRGPVSQFFSILERMLKRVASIDELIVGVGPGSYSGIRIGISAAIGLQLARNIPTYGAISALGYEGDNFQVVLDARGSWIYSEVRDGKITTEPINCTREELLGKLDFKAMVYSPDTVTDLHIIRAFPLASTLGKRVLAGQVVPQPLQPLYLKKPHITVAKGAATFPVAENL